MGKFLVHGGRELSGEIKPQGSKNEALQVICAALLTDAVVEIHNLPNIGDVDDLLKLMVLLGVQISKIGQNTYNLCARRATKEATLTDDFSQIFAKIRGCIMVLAPLLVRFKEVQIAKPGGDRIGRRGIHAHLEGLRQIGVSFSYDLTEKTWLARRDSLQGAAVLLPEPSVTATANLIMAASRAHGVTTIHPAACEPHIQQLCHMLVSMGAKIDGIGSNLLTIIGVEALHGTTHTISSDMLEVGSFIGLAAATGSAVTITDVPMKFFAPIRYCFDKLGILVEEQKDRIYIPKQPDYKIKPEMDGGLVTLYDAVWPGIPADLISVAIVAAVHARGHILIHQKMFESRLYFVDYLIEMGAQLVLCDPHRVHIVGLGNRHKLRGIHLRSSDIRAGTALLIAALAAEGTSVLENVQQIDRGHESIDKRLTDLGACIIRR